MNEKAKSLYTMEEKYINIETMKAIVFKKSSPNKLVYCDVEKPIPNENEVLIKIIAVSVNAADYRSMKMGLIPKKKIFGADIAGRVEAVGDNISQFRFGDEVIGELANYGFGGFAEYAVAPEKLLVLKPANISFDDAAALPMAAVTALQALRDKGNIKKGHNVLIIGSGGGVGTFAVQLAKHFDANVTAVCSTKNIEQTRSLGADIVIDYTKEDITKTTNLFDIVIAINGNYSLLACRRMFNPNGVYVMVGGALSQIFKSLLFGWILSFGSKKIRSLAAKPKQSDMEYIVSLANNGKIKPIIDKQFPLDKTVEAFKYLGEGHSRGKIVINVQ